jgi:Rad3-related DNA helicase
MKTAKKLSDQSTKLFQELNDTAKTISDSDEENENRVAVITDKAARHIRNIPKVSEQLSLILHDELFYIKAKELLAWARDKYDIDTSRFDLNAFISPTYEARTKEKQRQLMYTQMYYLQNAICKLPKLERVGRIEQSHRSKRQRSNSTERQTTSRNYVPLHEAVRKKAQDLLSKRVWGRNSEYITRIIWRIGQLQEQAADFTKHSKLICWLEEDNRNCKLCSIPKDLNKRLFQDQWNKGVPTVLTSGTLSANADFTHIKRALGLDLLKSRITETNHASPFDYRKNALLYISKNVPFPDQKNMAYINSVANEVEKLVLASHGHSAILFTSYRVMDLVWEKLHKKLPFPLFRLGKGSVNEIERFKASDGGVLFASGAMWEGIDIPGDALSMVVIVKLPFAVPDPISEYEQTLYSDFTAYRNAVIVPEMLVKLKQGFGRLIRTETDSGVVTILDSRVNGSYREQVMTTLPDCKTTSEIDDISEFMVMNKAIDYFDKDFKI